MADRRTRKEKIIARLRKKVQSPNKIEIKKMPSNAVFYEPEITLPVNFLVSDLTRTLAVTILALILIGFMYWYLQRNDGQYQLFLNMILNKLQ